LSQSALVRLGTQIDHARTPLVLHNERLYLDRYWQYQSRLCQHLIERSGTANHFACPEKISTHLQRLFKAAPNHSASPPPPVNWQKLATAMTAVQSFTIITGGPGTGKTTTVGYILRLFDALHQDQHPDGPALRVVLAAPTGKAATRMQEALQTCVGDSTQPLETLPPAKTLHRLLGWRPDTPSRFRHNHANPLPYDLIVVDETSMIDLPMMTKLFDAVSSDSRLVLLGDPHQLASVEAGSVLGDICGTDDGGQQFSSNMTQVLQRLMASPLDQHCKVTSNIGVWDSLVTLQDSHRFGSESEIGQLARAIRQGDASSATQLLQRSATHETNQDVGSTLHRHAEINHTLRSEIVQGSLPSVQAALDGDAAEALERLMDLSVLSPIRKGPVGVEKLNQTIATWIANADPRYGRGRQSFGAPATWHPIGTPIMVTVNDYRLRLFNGDVGVVVPTSTEDPTPSVAFRDPAGHIRLIRPSRMPAHEPVFAMTVHKSQGSQFGHAVICLPAEPTPNLSRELLYTAVTRARHRVTLVGEIDTIAQAIQTPVRRSSGLQGTLWQHCEPDR